MADASAPANPPTEREDKPAAADERLAHRGPIQQLLTRPEIGALLGAVGVWLVFWLVSGPFGTVAGTANYLDVASIIGLMAIPVALLMIGGEFDLSSGAMTGATAIIVILLSSDTATLGGAGLSLHLAVPLSLAFALAIGWFNGTMVEKTSLPSFIVTLGTFFILIGAKLGFAKLFTNKVIVEGLDQSSGYEFWDNIFGATWNRNTHIWDQRDWAWAGLLIIGGLVLLLGILELTYARREKVDPTGYGVAAIGAAAGLVAFFLMLRSDGGNLGLGILLGAGVLVGVAGWCLARYQPAAPDDEPQADRRRLMQRLGGGTLAIALAIALAAILDPFDSGQLDFVGGAAGRALLALGIALTGILAVLAALGRVSPSYPAIGAIIAMIPAVSFMMTVQAFRAILFAALAMAGVSLLAAAGRGRLKVVFSLLISVGIVALAFFVRSEASSRKLRVELFTALLLVALVIAAGAVAGLISARRTAAPSAPGMGWWTRTGSAAGVVAAVVFAIIELVDGDGILYSLFTGVVKGLITVFAIYAVGTVVRTLFTDDDGMGRALVSVGLGSVALGIAAKLLFVKSSELETLRGVTEYGAGVLIFLIFAVVAAWVLARTQFGSWIFAVGGNKDAARSVGVPAARTKTTLFMMVSAAAWITGMVIAFRLNSVQANVGDGNEFRYIIVAVVGGNLLTGGYGSAIGAAIGALIWGMIQQGIGFATWNSDWRFLVLGALLLIAVLANNYVRGRAEKAR
ncbi:MAG: hypothetical protein OXG47_04750 [bacterium]|nr:hypothetical protein [bacterium]MCY3925948.1 hypothetical protein [bacterium]